MFFDDTIQIVACAIVRVESFRMDLRQKILGQRSVLYYVQFEGAVVFSDDLYGNVNLNEDFLVF